MATARDIVTRALKSLSVANANGSVGAQDMQDGLDTLNEMLHDLKVQGYDLLHEDFERDSLFTFFVPPKPKTVAHTELAEGRLAASLLSLNLVGTWDASTNTPALSTETAVQGQVYKVSVAGATTLSEVSSWAVGDYLIFDGSSFLKSQNINQFRLGITAMLAVLLSGEYGRSVSSSLAMAAASGRAGLIAQFAIPGQPVFDRGLSHMTSQRLGEFS